MHKKTHDRLPAVGFCRNPDQYRQAATARPLTTTSTSVTCRLSPFIGGYSNRASWLGQVSICAKIGFSQRLDCNIFHLNMLRRLFAIVFAFLTVAHKSHAADSTPSASPVLQFQDGGIIRGPRTERKIALVFTAHEFAEGGQTILDELASHRAKGSFFVTGDFLANTNFSGLIRRIIAEGHYLGPHSDKHVLYCPWDGPKKTLVTREQFDADLLANPKKIEKFRVPRSQIKFFLPPYEHYNQEIVDWSAALGLTLVNYTPGTRSNADYLSESEKNFISSKAIYNSILAKEQQDPSGLNGFILLLHLGVGPGRVDKFHLHFGKLLDELGAKRYQLVRVDELLAKN